MVILLSPVRNDCKIFLGTFCRLVLEMTWADVGNFREKDVGTTWAKKNIERRS